MIYKPTCVFPNGNTCDMNYDNPNFWHFQFNGDELKYISTKVYNANTNEYITDTYFVKLSVYNGETVYWGHNAGDGIFYNGNNYKYNINLYQEKFNIFVLQGRVRKVVDNVVYLNWGITAIQPPIYYSLDNVETLFGAMYIEIGNQRRFIADVDFSQQTIDDNGYVMALVISENFDGDILDGSQYRIYSNYVTSAEYLLKARTTPAISINAEYNASDATISCTGTYSQLENVGVKAYKWSIYKQVKGEKDTVTSTIPDYNNLSDDLKKILSPYLIYIGSGFLVPPNNILTIGTSMYHITKYDQTTGLATLNEPVPYLPAVNTEFTIDDIVEELVEESDVIYNGRLIYTFVEIPDNTYYRLTFKVWTQDDITVETSVVKNFNRVGDTELIKTSMVWNYRVRNRVGWWYYDNVTNMDRINVYREEIGKEKVALVYDVKNISNFVDDFLVGCNKSYRYHLIPIMQDGQIGKIHITDTVTKSQDGWSIMAIKKMADKYYNRKHYETLTSDAYDETGNDIIRGVWYFDLSAECGDITQNINPITHTGGTGSFPVVTTYNNRYVSGSLTVDLATVECPTQTFKDDIERVEAWRKFIAQENLFVLKSPKGDVWIVAINENPTTKYDYTSNHLFTSATINYVQVEDNDNVIITPSTRSDVTRTSAYD